MRRRVITILVLCVGLSPGCLEEQGYRRRVIDSSVTPASMTTTTYLQTQSIPALLDVCNWPNRYGAGVMLITDRYEIHTTMLEPVVLSKLPGFLESAHEAYNRQLPVAVAPQARSQIYLFANRDQWVAYTRDFAGSQAQVFQKIQEGAYCLKGYCIAYDIGLERTFAALGHEGWHQFTSRHFKYRLPSWLDEGMAMLFEDFEYQNGLYHFDLGPNVYRMGALRRILVSQQPMSLRELLTSSPGEVMATDQADTVMAFYSQSYALVRFLREASGRKYLPQYQALIADSYNGRWPVAESEKKVAADRNMPRTVDWNRAVGAVLFQHYICQDIDQLETEYLAFCRQITTK